MRLLLTEYICGGGLANDPLPESLKQEGLMMLRSLVQDCLQLDDCHVVTTLDPRIEFDVEDCERVSIVEGEQYIERIVELATAVDFVWVIAPESDGVLSAIIQRLESQSIKTLNSDMQSIRLCSDKLKCAQHLQDHDINVVPSIALDALHAYNQQVVIKPRDGVGCENVQVFTNGIAARHALSSDRQWIAQPFVQGEHCSLSLLCYFGAAKILSVNVQEISGFPKPELKKCIVNAFQADAELHQMAVKIAQALPGLNGYVGVDFIKTRHGYMVVEINPRVTSSYIGLHQALNQNPAGLCFDVIQYKRLPEKISTTANVVEVALH